MCCMCNFFFFFFFPLKKKKSTLHCAINRTLYVRSQTRTCVQTHLRLFERRDPLHTHTQYKCECTYVRLITCILSLHVTFLGHFPPFFPSFLFAEQPCPHLCSHSAQTRAQPYPSPSHYPNSSIAPPRHCRTTAVVPITPISPPFSHFPFSHTKPNFSQKFTFCPHSLSFAHTNCENGLCVSFLCWIDLFLQGVGVDFRGVLKPLFLEAPTTCLKKIPQRVSSMSRGQVSASRSSRTQAMVARPPFESRKLILETTFTIKEDFSKNDATRWAVQELKRRGLKRLFKPVASTTCLV